MSSFLLFYMSKGCASNVKKDWSQNNYLNFYIKFLFKGQSLTKLIGVPYLEVGIKYPDRQDDMGRKYPGEGNAYNSKCLNCLR